MNLPPVPGSTPPPPPSPLPPIPPRASSALPPPPPPAAAPPGRLSRNAKRSLVIGGVTLTALAVISGLLAPPSDERVRAFVERELAKEDIDVQSYYVNTRAKSADRMTFTLTINGQRRAATGYVEVQGASSPGNFIAGLPGGVVRPEPGSNPADPVFDFMAWRRVKDMLSGKNGPRLTELSGLGAEAVALTSLTILREMKTSMAHVGGEITVVAQRSKLRWKLERDTANSRLALAGERLRPLSAFTGKVYLIDRAEDRAALAALAQRLPAIQARLDQAMAALFAENRAAFLALLKPKALFAGTAESRAFGRTETARVFIEITEVRADENPPRLSALLRNDGTWRETRLFSGVVALHPTTGALQLRLSSPHAEAREEGGPFLADQHGSFGLEHDADNDSVLTLGIDQGALTWSFRDARLRLEPVAEARREGLVAEADADYVRMAEATRAGSFYTGTITSRAKGTTEKWILRFTKQEAKEGDDATGADLEGVLEHAEHATWKCLLEGELEANRYRAHDGQIVLRESDSADVSPPREVTDLFRARGDSRVDLDPEGTPIALGLEGTRLVGENARFIFRFDRASPEFVADRNRLAAEREARLLEFIKSGAIHEGTVQRTGAGDAGAVRLRFTKSENRGESIEAVLQSAARPHFSTLLRGKCDLENSTLALHSQGGSPSWPGGPVAQAPDLAAHLRNVSEHGEEFAFVLAAGGVTGVANRGSKDEIAFAFPRLTGERRAELLQEHAARQARFKAFTQAGTTHEASLERSGVTGNATVMLRFLTPAQGRAESTEAILYSPARPRFSMRLTTQVESASPIIRLRSSGSTGANASPLADDPDLAPYFRNIAAYGAEVGLVAEGNVIIGSFAASNARRDDDRLMLRFSPASPERVTAWQRRESEVSARLQAFVEPGSIHEGTIQRASKTAGAKVRLRVLKPGPDGVEAVLQAADRPRYGLRLIGSQDPATQTVRFRFGGLSDLSALALSDDPELGTYLRDVSNFGPTADLSLEGDLLTGWITATRGSSDRPGLTFQVSSPERLAQLKQQDAAREQRLRDVARPGAAHDGTIRLPNGTPVRVRLRFTRTQGNDVEATLEIVDRPDLGWQLGGTLQPSGLMLKLSTKGYIGAGPKPADAGFGTVFTSLDAWNGQVVLALEQDTLAGNIGRSRTTKAEFALKN